MVKARVVFMGSHEIALPVLEDLFSNGGDRFEFVGVFTHPDRRSGRGMKVHSNPVKQWAQERGIAVQQPVKLGDEELSWLASVDCNLILVMSFGHILRNKFLNFPKLGIYNLHTSILPAYRGASPIETAIAMGEVETGVTLMKMVRAMDAGSIIDCERVSIEPEETAPDLYEKLANACVPLMRRNWESIQEGKAESIEQNGDAVTYCRRLTKEDGTLDFSLSAKEVSNRIRAFQPWPGGFFEFNGTRIKVGRASADEDRSASGVGVGEVVGVEDRALRVGTGDGILNLKQMQRPGGKMIAANDFLRGFPIPVGSILEGRAIPALVSHTKH